MTATLGVLLTFLTLCLTAAWYYYQHSQARKKMTEIFYITNTFQIDHQHNLFVITLGEALDEATLQRIRQVPEEHLYVFQTSFEVKTSEAAPLALSGPPGTALSLRLDLGRFLSYHVITDGQVVANARDGDATVLNIGMPDYLPRGSATTIIGVVAYPHDERFWVENCTFEGLWNPPRIVASVPDTTVTELSQKPAQVSGPAVTEPRRRPLARVLRLLAAPAVIGYVLLSAYSDVEHQANWVTWSPVTAWLRQHLPGLMNTIKAQAPVIYLTLVGIAGAWLLAVGAFKFYQWAAAHLGQDSEYASTVHWDLFRAYRSAPVERSVRGAPDSVDPQVVALFENAAANLPDPPRAADRPS